MIQTIQVSPAELLRKFLISQSGAVYTQPPGASWPLYVSSMPDGPSDPDSLAAIYDTAGKLHARLLKSGYQAQSYGVQLKNRSTDYRTAFRLAKATADQLSRVTRALVTLDGNSYTIDTVRQTSAVISLGQDERRRALVSVNFLLMLIDA